MACSKGGLPFDSLCAARDIHMTRAVRILSMTNHATFVGQLEPCYTQSNFLAYFLNLR